MVMCKGRTKEPGTDDAQEVHGHTEADVESRRAMQKEGLWPEGDTTNDTFLKGRDGIADRPDPLCRKRHKDRWSG